MVFDIAVGNRYPQLSLLLKTNKFFADLKHGFFNFLSFSDKEVNYTITIKHRCVTIALAENSTNNDRMIIKKYIEESFSNRSISIFAQNRIQWLEDVTNVQVFMHTEKENVYENNVRYCKRDIR